MCARVHPRAHILARAHPLARASSRARILRDSGPYPSYPIHQVTLHGEPISLPLKEFELLELLMVNAGRVLTRGQIIDRVWGSDYFGDTKTLDVHIKRLRSKIEKTPAQPVIIVTVRGLGYRFEA